MWKLVPIVLLVAGCELYGAYNPETATLTITSEPHGITVNVDGQVLTTPAVIEVSRRRSHTVTFPNGETVTVSGSLGWMHPTTIHYTEATGATYRKTPAQEAAAARASR